MTIQSVDSADDSAQLAREITRSASLQTHLVACWMVDQAKVADCHRAYAYFRWLDDVIDDGTLSLDQKTSFLREQRLLFQRLKQLNVVHGRSLQDRMLVDLLGQNRVQNDYLFCYIQKFFEMLDFDLQRYGSRINGDQLAWYSSTIGHAVTNAIFYFVGDGYRYPVHPAMYSAAEASHITHMLRDYQHDITTGYINIPKEYLETHAISPHDTESTAFREWVQKRVALARLRFHQGKAYIDQLPILRTKLVAYWYCVRFEWVLDAIERDQYYLRSNYTPRSKVMLWLRMLGAGIKVVLRHLILRGRRQSR